MDLSLSKKQAWEAKPKALANQAWKRLLNHRRSQNRRGYKGVFGSPKVIAIVGSVKRLGGLPYVLQSMFIASFLNLLDTAYHSQADSTYAKSEM